MQVGHNSVELAMEWLIAHPEDPATAAAAAAAAAAAPAPAASDADLARLLAQQDEDEEASGMVPFPTCHALY